MHDDDRHDIEMNDETGRYHVIERTDLGNFATLDEAKEFIKRREVALRFPKLQSRDAFDNPGVDE